jgi:hypothetical protein
MREQRRLTVHYALLASLPMTLCLLGACANAGPSCGTQTCASNQVCLHYVCPCSPAPHDGGCITSPQDAAMPSYCVDIPANCHDSPPCNCHYFLGHFADCGDDPLAVYVWCQ